MARKIPDEELRNFLFMSPAEFEPYRVKGASISRTGGTWTRDGNGNWTWKSDEPESQSVPDDQIS